MRFISDIYNGKKTCPFCFERFTLKETPFRCSSPLSVCTPEKDDILEREWQESTPIAKVLPPGERYVKEMKCPACGHRTRKRICPHCHMDLPQTIGEFKNYIFAIIGAKEAGKSHYLAVLIDYFRRHIGPSLRILLEPVNDYTIKRYKEDFYNPIFKDKRTIPSTESGLLNTNVRLPLIYSLVFSGKGLFGQQKITKGVTLSFFDTAGEDLNDQDTISTVNKYIHSSDGILVLLDPLQISYVRDQLGKITPLPEQNTETSEIVTRTTLLIKRARDISSTKKIKIPLAVTFSKIDALDSLLDSSSQLNNNSNHDRGFDVLDSLAINDEIQSLISVWDQGEALIQQVTTHFKNYNFFGLTALGCNPHGSNQIPRVIPRRVVDPFLWLLHYYGLVKGNK